MQSSWQRTRIRRRCVLTHFNSRSHFILTWQPKCHFNDTIGANKSLLVYLWQIEGFLFYIMQDEFVDQTDTFMLCWRSYLGQGKWECSQTGQWFPRWPGAHRHCNCVLLSSQYLPHSRTRPRHGSWTHTGDEREDRWDGWVKKEK